MIVELPLRPEKLTSAENIIIEYIAGHSREFIFMTIGQLASVLNISEATISRFAKHMGCEDFKHLKQTVMEQTVMKGPARKLANTLLTSEDRLLENWIEKQRDNLRKTLEHTEEKQFKAAVKTVAAARRVFIYAKNASKSPAQLLEYRLRRIGIDVRMLPLGGSEMLEQLSCAEKGDAVIIFAFSKISAEAEVILENKKDAGYSTILFSGRIYRENGTGADINLYVCRGDEDEYHSMCAPIAAVEAIVIGVSDKMGARAVEKLDRIKNLKDKYGKKI